MSNVGRGGRNEVIDLRITRWTTAAEREKLLSTIVESDADGIMRALTKLPSHGRMSVPGHRGPDPMKVVLGWTLHCDDVVRITPPLTLTESEADEALGLMREALG